MALYLGNSEKLKINFSGEEYSLKLLSINSILATLDNYILKDSNGLYLTIKGGE